MNYFQDDAPTAETGYNTNTQPDAPTAESGYNENTPTAETENTQNDPTGETEHAHNGEEHTEPPLYTGGAPPMFPDIDDGPPPAINPEGKNKRDFTIMKQLGV